MAFAFNANKIRRLEEKGREREREIERERVGSVRRIVHAHLSNNSFYIWNSCISTLTAVKLSADIYNISTKK